jgi:RNA polymerase sigma-70 factor (ECF subfamily)
VIDDRDRLAARFEGHRTHLKAVAYRMLGSLSEADDAVQETWLRLNRADAAEIDNLGGWLTTVVSRICLDLLRGRAARPEADADALARMPDPLLAPADGLDPEQEALLAGEVGLALQVVLEQLTPAERLAYVLHDVFAMPFEQVAAVVERTPAATRQLASRARRRVRAEAPAPDADLAAQREVVDAFFAASREGDFDALVAVLDPQIVLRASDLRGTGLIRGATTVAGRALTFRRLSPYVVPALVNGAAGVVVAPEGRAVSLMAFTVVGGRVAAIDAIADPERLEALGALAAVR